jgi:hypothetical protein
MIDTTINNLRFFKWLIYEILKFSLYKIVRNIRL